MKRSVFLIAVPLLFLAFTEGVVRDTSFEHHPAGTSYTDSIWQKDGFQVAWTQSLDKNSSVDDKFAVSGDKSLRVTYPEGRFGPSESGGQAKLLLEPEAEYYVSYKVRFSENFSWGGGDQGGKLPGLAGGENCSGGQSCDGTNGFSARYMWRTGGKAVLYLYHMDKPHKWGEDIPLRGSDGGQITYPKGEWIELTERVKVNSVSNGKANKDGEVQIWYNGEEALNLKGLRFVTDSTKVDNFYFSTFHGGNTPDWAPVNTCWIWYDDVLVTTDAEDVLN